MVFTGNCRSIQPCNTLMVALNDDFIERVENFKFLGITINEHLNWKAHMLDILSKIQRNLGIVYKIAPFLNRNSLFQLYHSLIMSHIRYGIVVWHHGNAQIRRKIQACSNKFLRLIFHLKPRDSVRSLMKENKLLSVNQIYHVEVSKIMQRHALGDIPSPFTDMLKGQIRLTEMRTRSDNIIVQGASRTNKYAQSIRCSGPLIFNNIPSHVKYHCDQSSENVIVTNYPLSFPAFKCKMKQFALSDIDFI